MFDRRDFLTTALGALILPQDRTRAPIIDGLGEIHAAYDDALLDEIRASGLRGCVVTVGNPALQGADAFDDMCKEIAEYDQLIAARPARLSKAVNAADIDRAAAQQTIGLVYYTQNATPLEDKVERLRTLYDLGVRIVQLTYNTRNLLGDGCLERTNAGLSKFGLEVVARMNELRMLVDVSHSGAATTLDAIRHSQAPVAITHAGCQAVYQHPRNKSDAALRALARKGGVFGIYQINPYLGPKERNTLDDFLRHLEHAINVCGLDHVAIGSDREHRTIPDTLAEKQKLIDELSRLRPVTAATFRWPFFISELNHPRRMETIAAALAKRGHKAAAIDKLLGGNWYRLLRDVLG
ncbi:MAG TPA: membrane dipeptidase [Blastocatellia bacterium]|nr:membrane dipeptidase [Blastocatellia bacterium]